MTTIAERKKIAKLVLTTNDDTIIEKIKSIILTGRNRTKDLFIKKYNKEIEEAVDRVRKGKFYSEEQADILLAEWEKE